MSLKLVAACIHGRRDDIVPTSQLQRVAYEDGCVSVTLSDDSGSKIRLSIVYTDADSYPISGALLLCEDSTYEGKIATLAERFQEKAPLNSVLSKVLDIVGIPYEEEVLRSAGSGNSAADTQDADGTDAMEEDDSQEEDGDSDPELSDGDDRELLLHCGFRTNKWERHEQELEAAEATSSMALSREQGMASKRQIFNTKEAFMRLSNELLEIMKRQDPHLYGDSVGDDIYQWDIWVAGFRPKSAVAKDLAEVSRRYNSSAVQLRFQFTRGLHPFYPPRVHLVRPHFYPPMAAAVAAHPMLKLANWDPWRPMMEVVAIIKDLLEAQGRIDVEHPRNAESHYPEGAYSAVQTALHQLEGLVEVLPAAHEHYKHVYDSCREYSKSLDTLQALEAQATKKPRRDAAPPADAAGAATKPPGAAAAGARAWAKGTGYGSSYSGSSYGEVWDSKATKAAQDAQDQQLQEVLERLVQALGESLGGDVVPLVTGGMGGPEAGKEDKGTGKETTAAAGGSSGAGASAAASGGQQKAGGSSSSKGAEDVVMLEAGGPGAAGPSTSVAAAGAGEPSGSNGCGAKSAAKSFPESEEEVVKGIQESVLLPWLSFMLSESLTQLVERWRVYLLVLRVVQQLCRPSTEALLVGQAAAPPPSGPTLSPVVAAAEEKGSPTLLQLTCGRPSVVGQLRSLKNSAQLLKTTMQRAPCSGAGPSSSSSSSSKPKAAAVAAKEDQVEADAKHSLEVVSLLLDVLERTSHLTPAPAQQPKPAAADPAAAAASAAAAEAPAAGGRTTRRTTRASRLAAAAAAEAEQPPGPAPTGAAAAGDEASEEDYTQAMQPLQVGTSSDVSARHHYTSHASADHSTLRARAVRVAREVAGLERMLPLNRSSSVFVQVDESNCFMWRALITGPEDTPYSGGCFIFDIWFPGQYPCVPPQVNMIAQCTGAGAVRFNPNLYNCGKVCLSLLGTWSGKEGEGWNAEVSTALQVLVSIQSLILVPDPYFNEPGYEASMQTEEGRQQSSTYNMAIREATIRHGMIDQLKKPLPEFAPVIRTHFKLRGPYLLRQIQGWIDDARNSSRHKSNLETLKQQLEEQLAALR